MCTAALCQWSSGGKLQAEQELAVHLQHTPSEPILTPTSEPEKPPSNGQQNKIEYPTAEKKRQMATLLIAVNLLYSDNRDRALPCACDEDLVSNLPMNLKLMSYASANGIDQAALLWRKRLCLTDSSVYSGKKLVRIRVFSKEW